ncbi:TraU family protein [Thiomicrospira sp.]|uniref:TraU family protein n=1 Tax=Thiomicrospira sp. TaxID=935 RepID=UPI002F924654
MKWTKGIAIFLVLGSFLYSAVSSASVCTGRFYNPITDTNWNNLFPITVAGVPVGGGLNPPTLKQPPICICPSITTGIPITGIGMTYHEPSYVAEVTAKPGCFHSLGGVKVLGGYEQMSGAGKGATDTTSGQGDRKQVHWYQYPLFAMLQMFSSVCMASSNGFAVGYITEIDPIWQDDSWSNIFSPESILFSNPIAHAACAIDAASALVYYPIDALFWCAGAWGHMYPMSGNPNSTSSQQQSNGLTLAKYLARSARIGLLKTTLTPAAQCYAFFNPIMVKTQFRINPIDPVPHVGTPIYIGQPEIRWGYFPPMNFQTKEESSYLLWNGTQCCLRP